MLVLILFFFLNSAFSLYLYSENPFKSMTGPLNIHKFHIERSEYSTFVVHPTQPGNYSVLFFIGGFAGVIPSELYSDLLQSVASFGIIVVGFDMIAPWKKPERFFKEYEYLKENLQTHISKHSKDVFAMIEYAGLFCHSGGCYLSAELIRENKEFAKLAFLIDPVGYIFSSPMEETVPTFVTGGGIHGGIGCAMPNISASRFFEEWKCPKVYYNQTKYGHCAPINELLVKPCSLVCGGGKESDKDFHRWIKGMIVAWVSVIFRDPKKCVGMKKYVFESSYFPIEVGNFKKDLECAEVKNTCLVN